MADRVFSAAIAQKSAQFAAGSATCHQIRLVVRARQKLILAPVLSQYFDLGIGRWVIIIPKEKGMKAHALSLVLCLILIFGLSALPAGAQTASYERLKVLLAENAGFEPEDFANVEKRKIVIKTLKSNVKREVAVVGLVKVPASNEIVLRAFHRTIERQERKTSKEHGIFGDPPAISDLKGLTIEERELDDLKNCRVGSCKWNFPAEVIKRFQDEIDWNADDYRARVDKLVREILLEYVIDYSEKGDEALFNYDDKPESVNLFAEYSALHKDVILVPEFSPRLMRYLDEFPDNAPPGIENTVNWSKIKIGLKNVVIFTQNITYHEKEGRVPASFVISKQIYANHYFDSSLAETSIVSFKGEDGRDESYLLFLNRSRAGAFTTTLGKIARGIVENQAESRLETVLKDTRKYSALALANREADIEAEFADDSGGGFLKSTTFLLAALLTLGGLAAGLIVLMLRRKR